MPPFQSIAPTAALLATGLFELATRRRKRDDGSPRDRGSFMLVNAAIATGALGAFGLRYHPAAWNIDLEIAWTVTGFVLLLCGIELRLWAIRTLGRFFTRKVQVSADQPVIENGPYRYLRHPSYTGLLLEFLGVAFTFGSLLSAAAMFVPVALACLYRISIEERALVEAIGRPYRDYMTRTKRLIPFVL